MLARPTALGAALSLGVLLLSPSAGAAEEARSAPAAAGAEWLGPRPKTAPRRVISLAPSATEVVLALGKGPLLVGVTRHDDAPAVARLPRVGGFLDPSPEAVLALRPDLVLWVADGGAAPAVRRIAALGVPVLAMPVVTVAGAIASARTVGAALGDASAGERLAASLEDAVARARRRRPTEPRPRVLLVVGLSPLVIAGPGSYPDELLRLAGADNAARSDRPWPVYPLERAVADDPDLVIDAALDEGARAAVELAQVRAVQRGALRRLPDAALLRPGPRLGEALETLRSLLHDGSRTMP